jgi:hypothetical protein
MWHFKTKTAKFKSLNVNHHRMDVEFEAHDTTRPSKGRGGVGYPTTKLCITLPLPDTLPSLHLHAEYIQIEGVIERIVDGVIYFTRLEISDRISATTINLERPHRE